IDETSLSIGEVATGREVRRFPNMRKWNPDIGTDIVLSSDGRTVATRVGSRLENALTEYHVRVLSVASGEEVFKKQLPHFVHGNNDEPFTCVALSPDGRLVAIVVPDEAGVRILETASGLLYHQFVRHRDRIISAAFAPDCALLATGG